MIIGLSYLTILNLLKKMEMANDGSMDNDGNLHLICVLTMAEFMDKSKSKKDTHPYAISHPWSLRPWRFDFPGLNASW